MTTLRRVLLLGVLLAAVCVLAAGCGGEGDKTGGTPAKKEGEAKAAASAQTKCPVMGGDIDRSIFADYQGQRVYFCCGVCPPKFKADPAKYVAQMQKEGIVLEKTPEGAK